MNCHEKNQLGQAGVKQRTPARAGLWGFRDERLRGQGGGLGTNTGDGVMEADECLQSERTTRKYIENNARGIADCF